MSSATHKWEEGVWRQAAVALQIGHSSGGASVGGRTSYLPSSEDSDKKKVPCAYSGPGISMVA